MNTVTNIAILDNNTLMRKALSTLLSSNTSLKISQQYHEPTQLFDELSRDKNRLPHVIILVGKAPIRQSIEHLSLLKNTLKNIPILILTEVENTLSLVRFMNTGASGYISKKCDESELVKAIKHLAVGGIYLPDFIEDDIKGFITNPEVLQCMIALNKYENEFLNLCCSELTYKEIAAKMNLSVKALDKYRESLFKKFNVCSRTGLVLCAIKMGLAL